MRKLNCPDDWRTCALGDISKTQYGTSKAADPNGAVCIVGMGHVAEGVVRLDDLPHTSLPSNEIQSLSLHKGDLLFNRTNSLALVGKVGIVLKEPQNPTVFASYMIRLIFDSAQVDGRYLSAWMQRGESIHSLKSLATPGVSQYNINPSTLLKHFTISLPSLVEQNAILQTLDRSDSHIRSIARLIAARRKLKRGMMQQLLTGKRRFPEFEDQPWAEVSLNDLLFEQERHVEWSDEEHYRLVSVRRRSGGFFDRELKPGRDIKSKSLKETHAGDFVLARMQILHGAMTITPPDFHRAHVSDSYMTFVPRDANQLHMPYFGYLSTTPEMYHKAYISSFGVAIEKMTFKPKWWLKETVRIPSSIEEQKKIADCLGSMDHEIQLLNDLHSALQEQKKGLMQQLLTGKVRVPESMMKEVS